MVLPRLFNTASRSAFTAAKRNFVFNRGLATAAPVNGKVRYVSSTAVRAKESFGCPYKKENDVESLVVNHVLGNWGVVDHRGC